MISVVQHVHFRINAGNLLGARETNRKGRSTLKARNALTSNPWILNKEKTGVMILKSKQLNIIFLLTLHKKTIKSLRLPSAWK